MGVFVCHIHLKTAVSSNKHIDMYLLKLDYQNTVKWYASRAYRHSATFSNHLYGGVGCVYIYDQLCFPGRHIPSILMSSSGKIFLLHNDDSSKKEKAIKSVGISSPKSIPIHI